MKKTQLLIDGDWLAFWHTITNEYPCDWGDHLWTLHGHTDTAMQTTKAFIEDLKIQLNAQEVRIALSDDTNWRKRLLPTYKENRKKQRKPLLYPVIRNWLAEEYKAVKMPTLEADDILGIWATEKSKFTSIIVGEDKDFKQIPCKHYNPHKAEEGVQEVTQDDADWWHLFQALTGDQTDGYTGLQGCGPKTAEKILGAKGSKDLWKKVLNAYVDEGFGEEEALIQARVSRILRNGEYENNEVKLWHP
jgi:DNA polymerase-1